MNILRLATISVLLLAFSACEFHQSVGTDLTTGAYYRGDGIGCDNIRMRINGDFVERNTFSYGERVEYIFEGIRGLTCEDSLVYPGMSVVIIKNEEDTILTQNIDTIEGVTMGINPSLVDLYARFTAIMGIDENDKYEIQIEIWDNKGDGTFTYAMPFSVRPNDLLTIDERGLVCANIYLWDETDNLMLTEPKVNGNNQLFLVLEEPDGFNIIDDHIYPQISAEVIDSRDVTIISAENILEAFRESGMQIDSLRAEGSLSIFLTFPDDAVYDPYRLRASLTDSLSDKRIDIYAEFEIDG